MTKPSEPAGSELELAEQMYAERGDDSAWDRDAADVQVRTRASEVVSVRVPSELFDEIEGAASSNGESISDFVRGAIVARLHGPSRARPSMDRVWSGVDRLVVRGDYVESWTEGPPLVAVVTVPDVAPTTVQGSIRRRRDAELFPDLD